MGSICHPKEGVVLKDQDLHEKQTIKVKDISELKSIKFSFTTEMLIHQKDDLLIVFMNHTTNFSRNDHFTRLPLQASKLADHANAALQKLEDKDPEKKEKRKFITFNIIIPTLNFNKVSIIFCDIWKEQNHNQTVLKDLLRDYFDSIGSQKLQSIAITQFPSQLGISLERGVKRIMRQIVRMPNKPQVIDFICLRQASKAIYMETINNHSQDVRRSFGSASSAAESDYF